MKKTITAPTPQPAPAILLDKLTPGKIADMLCEGHKITHIRELLAATGLDAEQVEHSLTAAIDELVTDGASLSENARRAWLFVSGKAIFRKQNELGDYSGAVQTLKALSLFKRPQSRDELEQEDEFFRLDAEANETPQ